MIVWGGRNGTGALSTGAQYLPSSNSWVTATSTGTGLAPARYNHTATWTGSVMVIWGGTNGTSLLSSGSRYNPGSNTWALMSVFGSPTARSGHSGVWTGSAVVLWGGFSTSYQNTGARYNPTTDLWSAVATSGAPAGRSGHTALWTGGWMLVWGGAGDSYRNTGGRYALGQGTDSDGDGYTYCNGDCNDASSAVHPGATENCNGMDDNCAGGTDEGFDQDSDGFATCRGDCDDSNAQIWPGAQEICNTQDDNCNQVTDEGADALCADANPCTFDMCSGIEGCQHDSASQGSFCDDGNDCTFNERCLSGTCQGGLLRDADGDIRGDLACGGTDCNDLDGQVWLPPQEVTDLSVTGTTPANVQWSSQGFVVGPATYYDLMSGLFGPSSGPGFAAGNCLQMAGGSSYSDIRVDPTMGTAFWYLARALNACGVGTFGSPSRDAAIPPCP
jgi:hypothetical protein